MPTGQCITVVKAGAAMGVSVILSQRCKPRPGRCGRSGIPRIPLTRLAPLLQGTGVSVAAVQAASGVDAVAQVYRVYRRRGLRRCYRGRVFLWQRCRPRQDSTRQDVSRDTAPKTRARP